MHISCSTALGQPSAQTGPGLILPQLTTLPGVTGDDFEGEGLVADTADSWSYDGAPATVTGRAYQLVLDGVPIGGPQPAPSLDIPLGTGGASYVMQLRVQVAEAAGLWSPWVTIASGTVGTLPQLSVLSAVGTGTNSCTAEVSTDTGTGTLYWDVTETAMSPPISALKSAQSQPITSAGLQTVTATGLSPDTTYYVHFVQNDGVGHDSASASSVAFTTEAEDLVPAAFAPGDWSVTDTGTGGDAVLAITALPFPGAAAINDIEWRIGSGAWTSLGASSVGTYPLEDTFTDGVAAAITLRARNLIGAGPASDVKTVTTSEATGTPIPVGPVSYTEGSGGAGPRLDITEADLTGTTGPYTLFLATHPAGTSLTPLQIETGTGDALDARSLQDADGIIPGAPLTLSTSLVAGHLSLFLRDAMGAASAVIRLDGVDVDATAPTITEVTATATGSATADWQVQTDEDGGTIYVRARLATAPPWTAAEIIAAPTGSVAASVLASTAPALYGGLTEPGLIALWDAAAVPDGAVTSLPDLSGPFDLTAVAAPNAAAGVITFDGTDDVLTGAAMGDTGAPLPGARHLRNHMLPDASGSDPGTGFSIAGLAYDDADGTWWAANGGLNYDGSTADRQQSLVHLSSDFTTNLGEIDLDAVLPDLEANDESPQAVAVDNGNGYLWVGDPSAQTIRCFDKAAGTRVTARDITRSFDIGSLAIAEAGDALWVMSRGASDATIQKISTDGTATVTANITVDLDNRHDHLCEKDGVLYISCGTNGGQAFVVAVDPAHGTVLSRTLLPYPGGPNGMVGIEGIQIGPSGTVFIAHNGYFHYGDPNDPKAPDQWPRTNIVAEYDLPTLGSEDVDLFALVDASPSGADCLFQFGSPLDTVKTRPSLGLYLNGSLPAIQLRKNTNSGGDAANLTHSFDGPVLIYITLRGAAVTFYVNGVEAGTDTLSANGQGLWGPVHPPELGAAHSNSNRHIATAFYAAGAVLGTAADRHVIEGALAHRHGLQALLPAGHPYAALAP